MGKKVFITGAGGFIGANLVRALLARGDETHVLSRPESSFWRLDEIKEAISGHLCRCTGYNKMIDAISECAKGKIK